MRLFYLLLFWFVVYAGPSQSSKLPTSEVIRTLERLTFAFATFLGDFRSRNDTSVGDSWRDKRCAYDLEQFGVALRSDQQWASEMYDIWGKIPSGLLEGNFFSPGSFDQCRRFAIANSAGIFSGQHCTVQLGLHTLGHPLPSLWLGICVPDSCEPHFVKNLTDYFALEHGIAAIQNYNQEDFCYRDDPIQSLSGTTISAIIILSLIVAIVLASTAAEVMGLLLNRPAPDCLVGFSLYRNLILLFKTVPKSTEKTDTLDCVNGIRSVMMLQIVIHHVHDAVRALPATNHLARQDYFKSEVGILNYRMSALSVDIFLVLSALLLTYSIMKELTNRAGKFSVSRIWIHRIVRIVPAYGFTIFVVVAFGQYFGEGPLYRYLVQPAVEACSDNWWTALLFVQNYANPEQMCLPYTWYLSVDMQLYLISPLVIYMLWRFGTRSLLGVSFLVLVSVGCVFTTFMYNDFRLNPPMSPDREFERARLTYYPTHARMSVWFCGVAFGYFLFRTRESQVKWSVQVLTAGSLVATALTAFIMFATHEVYKPRDADPLGDAFYEALHRVAWASCLMWLIFMCINGYGSVLGSFLSWSFWQPVARLSYCMYLIHYVIIMATFGGVLRQPFYFSVINIQYLTMGVLGLTAGASLVLTIFIERPFLAVEKNIRHWMGKSQQ